MKKQNRPCLAINRTSKDACGNHGHHPCRISGRLYHLCSLHASMANHSPYKVSGLSNGWLSFGDEVK